MGNRFLLLDSRIVEDSENAELVLGIVEKHPCNPIFGEDKLWEKRFDNLYPNILYDEEEQLYKCWYSPFIVAASASGMSREERKKKSYYPAENREMGICYATSTDGINWVKPEMGLVEYEGSKVNNILWRGSDKSGESRHGPHGAGIFEDVHDPNPARRYKAILKAKTLSVAFSADGIRWRPPIACPDADVPGDTHNNAFWAPTLGKYVGITREWGPQDQTHPQKKVRQVARIESEDFINWSKAEVILQGTDPDHQIYSMPVFFYGGVYLGLLSVHEQVSDRVWTELAWSADTKTWQRISPDTPLIPNLEEEFAYDYGCVYACAYPVFLENEIRIYYGGSDWLHNGWRNAYLCLATLRPDGFAGYQQQSTDRPAITTTAAFPYTGQLILITADVSNGGSIAVTVLDKSGKEISAAKTVVTTVTDAPLKWNATVENQHIRLKFKLDRAIIYSFGLGV